MSVKLTIEVPAELVAALQDGTASNTQRAAVLDAVELAARDRDHDSPSTQRKDSSPDLNTPSKESAGSHGPETYPIFLRNLRGKTTVLVVSKDVTTPELHQKVFEKERVGPTYQRLRMVSGRSLSSSNGNQTLEKCGIVRNSTIDLYLGWPAGQPSQPRVKEPETDSQPRVGECSSAGLNTQDSFEIEVKQYSLAYERRWVVIGHGSMTVKHLTFVLEQRSGIEQKRQRLFIRGAEIVDKGLTMREVRRMGGTGPIIMMVSRKRPLSTT